MKKGAWVIGAVILLAACNEDHGAFLEKVAGADSVGINYFRGDGRTDTVTAVKIVRDKAQITQLSNFVAGPTTSQYKCGYDGSLHYFKRGIVVQDVLFKMNDVQCMHFSFMFNGQSYTTALKPEARQLLEGFRK
jgi:hypothetical protein